MRLDHRGRRGGPRRQAAGLLGARQCLQTGDDSDQQHFFNPPTVLRLVEVISSESTSQETIDEAMAFCDSIDRLTVRVKDTPGFIVNRLLVPFIFDAVRMVESGTATAGDIDQACKVGLNHAMGPLATADLIGLDTLIQISESMFEEYGES